MPGFIPRLCSRIYPDDPQAVVTLASAITLLVSMVSIVGAIVYRIASKGDIGAGACWALGVAVAGLCVLAHVKPPFDLKQPDQEQP